MIRLTATTLADRSSAGCGNTASPIFSVMQHVSFVLLFWLALTGCATSGIFVEQHDTGRHRPKAHAVFFDGTGNDPHNPSNVLLLKNHVVQQGSARTLYIEGVGTKDKWLSAATGLGFGERIRLAYRYLLGNHQADQDLYVFGFSRGAYSARVLASLIHYAGLPSTPITDERRSREITDALFQAYRGNMTHEERVSRIQQVKERFELGEDFRSRPIAFMGLWDTVESLGWPKGLENPDGENRNYVDQLCNVQRAAHALSLDDHRAIEFTPVLLDRRKLLWNCDSTPRGEPWTYSAANADERLRETVDEVWFVGAHSDVGGGYTDSYVAGISLNWMTDHLVGLEIVDDYEFGWSPVDRVHDPQREFLDGRFYTRKPRSLEEYALGAWSTDGKLKIHPTVLQRLSALGFDGPRSAVGLGERIFTDCFCPINDGRYRFHPKDTCKLMVAGRQD